MKWKDTLDIAQALQATHADIDPRRIRFTDLHAWVLQLPDFDGTLERCNERILEAIQMAWIDEAG
jgi:FeS assembly protein IscX